MKGGLSDLELVVLIAVGFIVLGLAPYVTWRRGGSRARIVVAFLVSLIPYLGLIAGIVIAVTTKSARGSTAAALERPKVDAVAGAAIRRNGRAGGVRWIVSMFVLALGVFAGGVVGYYVGRNNVQASGSATSPTRSEPRPLPTWTDREIRATGTQNVGTLRCTYHLADGTVRVRESVIALSTNAPYDPFRGNPNLLGAGTPECATYP
jgi:hypothetical protein